MQIIKKEGNTESTYEIVYDEQVIRKLIADIIRNCSFRRKESHRIEARSEKELLKKIDSAVYWNDIKLYENVKNIKQESVNDPFDYWRHGDPVPFSFEADTLCVPELATFLINLLEGKEINYDWFIKRKELSYKEEMLEALQTLDSEINQVSNFDTETKIRMLEELSKKAKYINSIPNFDLNTLENYYSVAETNIKLELVQQIIRYRK